MKVNTAQTAHAPEGSKMRSREGRDRGGGEETHRRNSLPFCRKEVCSMKGKRKINERINDA